jgi:hypothetical protein
VTRYATSHLAAQFRTNTFSILRFHKSARLMRLDHSGVIVRERAHGASLEIQQC